MSTMLGQLVMLSVVAVKWRGQDTVRVDLDERKIPRKSAAALTPKRF